MFGSARIRVKARMEGLIDEFIKKCCETFQSIIKYYDEGLADKLLL